MSGDAGHGMVRALVGEVLLLLDFVSRRPEKSIYGPMNQDPAQRAANSAQIIYFYDIVNEFGSRRGEGPPLSLPGEQIEKILSLKDRLSLEAGPANTLTIAFTTMAVGSFGGLDRFWRDPMGDGGMPPTDRRRLAMAAFPGLIRQARWLSLWMMISILLLLLLTGLTTFLSGITAEGRGLVDQLDSARKSYAIATDAISTIEMAPSGLSMRPIIGGAPNQPTLRDVQAPDDGYIRYCDRARLLQPKPLPGYQGPIANQPQMPRFADQQQAKVCGQLWDADVQLQLVKTRIRRFQERFQHPVTHLLTIPTRLLTTTRPSSVSVVCTAVYCAPAVDRPEASTADFSLLMANYVLPFCFTLIGAGVATLRALLEKVSQSRLEPRDLPLSFGRMALGMVAGAAVGLFFTPSHTEGDAVSLSAQGLAFLAGYGIEALFNWLDKRVVKDVFANKEEKPAVR